MSWARIIVFIVVIEETCSLSAQNYFEQLTFEQFGDRYGHVKAMCRDRFDNLYMFANRLNDASEGYEPVVYVKRKGGCWRSPEFIMGSGGQAIRSARMVASPVDNSINMAFI